MGGGGLCSCPGGVALALCSPGTERRTPVSAFQNGRTAEDNLNNFSFDQIKVNFKSISVRSCSYFLISPACVIASVSSSESGKVLFTFCVNCSDLIRSTDDISQPWNFTETVRKMVSR